MLDTAFRADPYDPVTLNLLRVLDTLDGFDTLKADVATIRLHPDESPVLRLYAGPLAAKALAEMRVRYGLEMKGPVTIQIFPKHDDFAVRTTGLMGMVGALGASFGSVVTQDSPRARPPGSFNWQATLWHELAHVFTLQLSKQRVPRWVTEGISVYEEGLADPSWARDSELGFVQAYSQGKVLRLADLTSGFARPDTISLAYFQSSLVVSLLVERHGPEALRVMLRAFADGADVESALQKATRAGLADLQKAFDAQLETRYGSVAKALRVPDGVELPREGHGRGVDGAGLEAPRQLSRADGRRAGAGVGQREGGRRGGLRARRRRSCRSPRAATARAPASRNWPSGAAIFAARFASGRRSSRTTT